MLSYGAYNVTLGSGHLYLSPVGLATFLTIIERFYDPQKPTKPI